MEIERPALLVIIRHAESMRNKAKKGSTYFADENARKDVQGIPDHNISITEEGHRQAKETGIYLRQRFGAPDYVYHSGYARTIQTAEGILSAYDEAERENIAVRMNSFVRERDSGYAYDMTEEEAAREFPWLQAYWDMVGGFFARPPGGESLADVVNRVYTFLNTVFRDRAGKKVFVVSHGGTIRCFRYLLEHWGYDQALHWSKGQAPHNCGVTVYKYNPEKKHLVLEEYNAVGWK